MRVAKINDGRLVELIRYCVPVQFDPAPHHWCFVGRPIGLPITSGRKTMWWVPATSIVWHLDFGPQ